MNARRIMAVALTCVSTLKALSTVDVLPDSILKPPIKHATVVNASSNFLLFH